MISIKIDKSETSYFQYLLPALGSLETIELVKSILEKIDVGIVEFTEEEFFLLRKSINTLDAQEKLPLQCLSLIRKIVHYQGDK